MNLQRNVIIRNVLRLSQMAEVAPNRLTGRAKGRDTVDSLSTTAKFSPVLEYERPDRR
jgi:hypothetical protein